MNSSRGHFTHIGDLTRAELGELLFGEGELVILTLLRPQARFSDAGGTSPARRASVVRYDVDLPDDPVPARAGQDRPKEARSRGPRPAPASLGQQEGPLELPGGDAAMQISPLPVLLATTDHELVFLDRDLELVAGETGHRQRDAQALRLALGARSRRSIL